MGRSRPEVKPVVVGLLGLGTVNGGVATLLRENAPAVAARAGARIEVRAALVRDACRARSVPTGGLRVTADPAEILDDPEVSVVVEAMGGLEPARTLLLRAIARGKAVATANKELVARAGPELFSAGRAASVPVLFEGAVGGAIPMVRGLAAVAATDPIIRVRGILNTTTAFLLHRMGAGGTYAEALAEARRIGVAEPDPSDDVSGRDAAYKLAILAAMAFGGWVDPAAVPTTGITGVGPAEAARAAAGGRRLHLVAEAQRAPADTAAAGGGVRASVAPVPLAADDPLAVASRAAGTQGTANVLVVEAEAAGTLVWAGTGGGALPTASAVGTDVLTAVRWAVAAREGLAPRWVPPYPPEVTLRVTGARPAPLGAQAPRSAHALEAAAAAED